MKIFIDLGSHVGESIINLRELVDINQEFKIYGFEPHPIVFKKAKHNIENYKKNSNINLFEKAGYINDNDSILYQHHALSKLELKDQINNYNELGGDGSSTLNINKKGISKEGTIKIKCVNVASFFKDIVTEDDYVILKMDIEGAEYELIPHLIENNIFKMVNIFLIEFHSVKVNLDPIIDKKLMNNIKKQNENIIIITEEQAMKQKKNKGHFNGNWFHMVKNII